MHVTFKQTTNDMRDLYKSYDNIFDCGQVSIYQNCSLLTPSFMLSYNANIVSANAFYVHEWGLYYFIDNVSFDSGGKMYVSGYIDSLQSYNQLISNLFCTITRQEFAQISPLPDSNISVKNFDAVDIYPFDNGFDVTTGSYVLQVLGG